jgi:hypothetical protein
VQPSRVSFHLPILEYIPFAPGTFARRTFLDLTGTFVTNQAPGMASALLSIDYWVLNCIALAIGWDVFWRH